MRTRQQLDAPRGYVLSSRKSFWGVVAPEATVNLVPNPSAERGVSGWAVNVDYNYNATLVDASNEAMYGSFSFYLTTGFDGSFDSGAIMTSDPISVVPGQTYTWSFCYKIDPANPFDGFTLRLVDSGSGSVLANALVDTATPIAQKRGWFRREALFTIPTGVTSVRLGILVSDPAGRSAWFDGFQFEQKPYRTTYCDGDLPNSQWTGLPHRSSSRRASNEQTGGRIVNFKQFGFTVLSVVNALAPALTTVDSAYALVGGGYYQRSTPNIQQFTIVGEFEARSLIELKENKRRFLDSVKPYRFGGSASVRLVYQPVNDCEAQLTDPLLIDCVYAGGLEGTEESEFAQRASITFRTYLPAVFGTKEFDSSTSLGPYDGTIVKGLVIQGEDGLWTTASFNLGQMGRRLYEDRNKNILILGGINGVNNKITRWLNGAPGTYDSMNTAPATTNGDVLDVAIVGNNDVYAVGQFTTIGGVGSNYAARWNGTAWNAMSGLNGQVRRIVLMSDGRLFAGGTSTLINGAVDVNEGQTIWNGAAWVQAYTGMIANHPGNGTTALAASKTGRVYWAFQATNPSFLAKLGYRGHDDSYNEIGRTNTGGVVNALAEGLDGVIYAGGTFTTIAGQAVTNIAKWTGGNSWRPVGGGLNGTVTDIQVDGEGRLHVIGSFTQSGGLSVNGYAIWTGGTWIRPAIKAGNPMVITPDRFAMASISASPFLHGYVFTIDNKSASNATPRIVFKGVGNITLLHNHTTGQRIEFNYTLVDSEEVTLALSPTVSLTSSIFGDVSGGLIKGGVPANFVLKPGANTLEFFAYSGLPICYLTWKDAYDSIDSVFRQ